MQEATPPPCFLQLQRTPSNCTICCSRLCTVAIAKTALLTCLCTSTHQAQHHCVDCIRTRHLLPGMTNFGSLISPCKVSTPQLQFASIHACPDCQLLPCQERPPARPAPTGLPSPGFTNNCSFHAYPRASSMCRIANSMLACHPSRMLLHACPCTQHMAIKAASREKDGLASKGWSVG